jgi:hypothetical protein
VRPDFLDQWLPHRPDRIREELVVLALRHAQNMGTAIKI